MILDKQNQLSDSQAITATAKSTNTIDLGPNSWAKNSVGACVPPRVEIVVTEAFTAAGAATMAIQVRSSANSDMSSPVVHFTTDVIGKAALVPGYRFPLLEIPEDAGRYFDLNFVVATGPMTAGKVTAACGFGHQTNR